MNTKEISKVVEAELDGETIQMIFKGNIQLTGNCWFLKPNGQEWDFIKYDYRVKPKEKTFIELKADLHESIIRFLKNSDDAHACSCFVSIKAVIDKML